LYGRKNAASTIMVTIMQLKHNHRKGCVLFAIDVCSEKENEYENDEVLRKYLVFQ